MKQRRLLRFHSLKRGRVRPTWNKYNLFNLYRLRTPYIGAKTFFQQKWIAKSMTRAYHGEHIKEYQWERMFSRRLLSAVNMDPTYMAKFDGSEQAAGRGSGHKPKPVLTNDVKRGFSRLPVSAGPRNTGNLLQPTPYMQMVYAPLERRLDIAIFRALFASSPRQARQFVLHGAVTVNGKKMCHPGYLLNPGDMFQVEVDRVLYATGKQKIPLKDVKTRPDSESSDPAEAEAEAEAEEAGAEAAEAAEEEPVDEAAKDEYKAALKEIRAKLTDYLGAAKGELRAKHKIALRQLLKRVKTAMSRAGKVPTLSEMRGEEHEMASLLADLTLSPAQYKAKAEQQAQARKPSSSSSSSSSSPSADVAAAEASGERLPGREFKVLRALVRHHVAAAEEARVDASKSYATPWLPRDYMAPFAFIPRYLEVNQRICAAVYLRHPVARPGRSEVPSPFPPMLSQLTFNWYLRRR